MRVDDVRLRWPSEKGLGWQRMAVRLRFGLWVMGKPELYCTINLKVLRNEGFY